MQKWWAVFFGLVLLATFLIWFIAPFYGWWLPDNVSSFGPLTHRRWLLLDAAALKTATLTPHSLAEVNARFSLVDLRVGPATVVVPPTFHGRWSARGAPVTVSLTEVGATCTAESTRIPCA